MWTTGEMLPTGKNLGQKPVPVALCPPQTPYRLVLDLIQASKLKAFF